MTVYRIETPQVPWSSLGQINRATAAADSALGATERLYSTAKLLTNTVSAEIAPGINAIEVCFKHQANDDDSVVDFWAARTDSDDLKRVCTLTLKGGAQTDGVNFFADTITVSNNNWLKTVNASDNAGGDQLSTLWVDITGYSKVLFHGHTTADDDLQIEIAGF